MGYIVVWLLFPVVALIGWAYASTGAGPLSAKDPQAQARVSISSGAALTLDCTTAIDEVADPPDAYEVIGGAIALPTSVTARTALQVTPVEQPLGLFSKVGLLVRSGVRSEVVVPSGWRGRSGVLWGSPAWHSPTAHLSIPACAARGEWLAFAGGIYVARPDCVPVIVRVQELDSEVHIGVGAPCNGQAAPPSTS